MGRIARIVSRWSGAEADVDRPQARQRLQHQAGADQQHQRRGDLQHDQRVAGGRPPAADAAAPALPQPSLSDAREACNAGTMLKSSARQQRSTSVNSQQAPVERRLLGDG